MYIKKTALILVSIIAVVISACSSNNQDSSNTFKIGIVSNSNGKNNSYLNSSAMKGITKFAKEENLKKDQNYKYITTSSTKSFEKKITKMADSNYDLIIGIGNNLSSVLNKVAENNKSTKFGVIDSRVDQPNVISINFTEQDGSFLAGVIAAMKTKTKKVGFIGGDDNEIINRYKYGFISGVKSVNKEIEVLTAYSNTFNDPKIGSRIANDFFMKDVDIIFPVTGLTSKGVFTTAKKVRRSNQREVWVIGADRNEYRHGLPENVTLISLVKKIDQAVYDLAKQTKSNEFHGGKTLIYGLNEDGIKLILADNNVEDSILVKVNEYKDKIQSGSLVVPSNKEEYLQFIDKLI
ncbi:BMP family ABC transporter substrate-binding protein [Gottfriedia sp. S16(2024)]|uniref:BMP family lipoprotein n=1 Tax=Gottfriedia sp. S16(2024) TaxID=3162883 RepID=UPI003D210102